jgi:hypothetical protein
MKHILITKTYKKQRVFATLSTQRYLYWVELVDSWLDSDVKKQFLVFKSSSPRIDAARQMNVATRRAARAAQSAEQQQAARE